MYMYSLHEQMAIGVLWDHTKHDCMYVGAVVLALYMYAHM